MENWTTFYREYMTRYHKTAWAEYKKRHGIEDRPFVRQRILVRTLCQILRTKNVIEEARFDWLRAASGKLLRIDAYFPHLKLAVEYDGEQHFSPVVWNGQTREQAWVNFRAQKERDRVKSQFLQERGIRLIRFSHREKIDDLMYVQEKLISSGIPIEPDRESAKIS